MVTIKKGNKLKDNNTIQTTILEPKLALSNIYINKDTPLKEENKLVEDEDALLDEEIIQERIYTLSKKHLECKDEDVNEFAFLMWQINDNDIMKQVDYLEIPS